MALLDQKSMFLHIYCPDSGKTSSQCLIADVDREKRNKTQVLAATEAFITFFGWMRDKEALLNQRACTDPESCSSTPLYSSATSAAGKANDLFFFVSYYCCASPPWSQSCHQLHRRDL